MLSRFRGERSFELKAFGFRVELDILKPYPQRRRHLQKWGFVS